MSSIWNTDYPLKERTANQHESIKIILVLQKYINTCCGKKSIIPALRYAIRQKELRMGGLDPAI